MFSSLLELGIGEGTEAGDADSTESLDLFSAKLLWIIFSSSCKSSEVLLECAPPRVLVLWLLLTGKLDLLFMLGEDELIRRLIDCVFLLLESLDVALVGGEEMLTEGSTGDGMLNASNNWLDDNLLLPLLSVMTLCIDGFCS